MSRALIDAAIDTLVQQNTILFHHGLHEQNLVGCLAYCLQTAAIQNNDLARYYADVEYNRAVGGVFKIIPGGQNHNNVHRQRRVFVDLVLHGRGLNGPRENIICCEMKKRMRRTAWVTPEVAARDIFQNRLIVDDQRKIIDFTTAGNPYNREGHVVGYEIGVLIVPRYDPEGVHDGLVSRIQEVFVRYYARGEVLHNEDRIIEVPHPVPLV